MSQASQSCTPCKSYDKVQLDEFVPYVAQFVQHAPVDMMKQHIRAAAIELITKTATLTRDLYVPTQDGVADYDLVLEDDYVIRAVEEVCLNGVKIPHREKLDCCGVSQGYYFDRPCSLLINPTPDSDCKDALLVKVVVAPSHQSCTIDRWIYEYYAEEIATGALSRIMLVKGANWYDTKQGGIMLRRWKGILAQIKTEKSKNFTTGPTIIKVKRWI